MYKIVRMNENECTFEKPMCRRGPQEIHAQTGAMFKMVHRSRQQREDVRNIGGVVIWCGLFQYHNFSGME